MVIDLIRYSGVMVRILLILLIVLGPALAVFLGVLLVFHIV